MVKRTLLMVLVVSCYCFAGINLSGKITDLITQQPVSGAIVSIAGTILSTTTDSNGNFTISNFPRFSTGFQFKASKSGYVDTYTQIGNSSESDETDISIPLISNTLYNQLHTPPLGVSHTSGKGDILGLVSADNRAGVVITARYMDNNALAGTIRYVNENNQPDPSLNSTSSNGAFIIYNVDPYKSIKIIGTRLGTDFSSAVVICYPDTVTLGGIEESVIIPFSATVGWEENPVPGATVSIHGTTQSTTTDQNGNFTLNFNPVSYGVIKISKTGYVDCYFSGRADEVDNDDKNNGNGDDEEDDEEFFIIPQDVYNQVLQSLGRSHIQGKGDIIGMVSSANEHELEGVRISLYDRNGTKLNPDIFYFDEEGPVQGRNETTPEGQFLIINLDPGYYFLVGEKSGMEFSRNMVIVFANGIMNAPEIIGWPPVPVLVIDKAEDVPSRNISNNAQNVKMLAFQFYLGKPETGETVIFDSMIVTSKGTGNIASALSSAKLYVDSNWDNIYETLVSTGTIAGNKITFGNINKEIDFGLNQKYAIFFDFNGTASIGQTFGLDILSYYDVYAHAKNTGISIICEEENLPVEGNLMTIAQIYPPNKPTNLYPSNNATGIDPWSYNLQSSPFSPGQGSDVHRASQWRMWKDGESYETFTWYDVENQENLTSVNTPVFLQGNTKYWWQVKHQNDNLAWSDWSDATCFTTSEGGITPPAKPINQSPSDGQIDVSLPVILTGSQFIGGSSPYHVASQWQVFIAGNGQTPVFDTKRDTNNLTSITVSGLSYNTQYAWRVRYQDIYGAWSDWSEFTFFTTKEGIKGDLNGDTEIDISDVILCLRQAIGLDPVNDLADMNDDGEVDISDVILILRKAIGLD